VSGRPTITVPLPDFYGLPVVDTCKSATHDLRTGVPLDDAVVAGVSNLLASVAKALEGVDEGDDHSPDLIIEDTDYGFAGRCAGCGQYLREIGSQESFDLIAGEWADHVLKGACA